jgi:signal transduction histidine kinase/FixJ family two-component response regulator
MARERILIVDDEIETRDVCKRLLSKKGYSVKFAEDGRTALKVIRDNYFQVVLADLKMPGIDGLTLLKRIKEERPRTEVIIITGYASINTAVKAMRIGAYDYIVKPFDINELALVVGRCLEKQRLTSKVGELKEVVALYEVSKAMRSVMDLGKLLKTILKLACETMAGDGGVLMLFDRNGKELLPRVRIGLKRKWLGTIKREIEERIPEWTRRGNSPLLLRNMVGDYSDGRKDKRFKSNISGIAVPLRIRGRVFGVISVNNFRGNGEKFTGESAKLLTIFATNASLALENAKVYVRLEQKKKDLEEANERLRELDKLKSQFVFILSGELRRPLAAVQGAIDLLAAKLPKELTAEKERLIKIARNNTHRMGKLIEELLDFSRIEASTMKLKMEKVSLSEVVSEAVIESKTLLDKREISLQTFLPRSPAEVFADFYRLKQVIVNLLKNAVNFTPHRGRVAIQVEDREKEVQIAVEDTGRGIPSKNQSKIFQKFYQVNGSWIKNAGGFGLGLYIAKAIVEAHGGRIWVKSAPGKGSKFTFIIPKEKRAKPRPCQSELPNLFDYFMN